MRTLVTMMLSVLMIVLLKRLLRVSTLVESVQALAV